MAVTMSVITVKRPQVSVPTISTFVARLHSHALVFTLQWWPEFPQHLPFRECGFVITIVGHWNSTVQSTAEGMSFSTGQTGYIGYSTATCSDLVTSQAWPDHEITFHCPLNKHSMCNRLQHKVAAPPANCGRQAPTFKSWRLADKAEKFSGK